MSILIPEKFKNRKRQNIEQQEDYIINHFQISGKSFSNCPLFHKLNNYNYNSVVSILPQNKIKTKQAIVRSLCDVLKIVLNSYISTKNSDEYFQKHINEEIDNKLSRYNEIINEIKYNDDIYEIMLECESLFQPNLIVSMINEKIDS